MKIHRIKKFLFICLIIALIFVIIKIIIYAKSGGYHNLEDPAAQLRGIGSPLKLWLNGYMAIFFRYNYFGFANFLLFPLLIYFLFTIEKRKRWEVSLFLVLFFSILLIGTKGYRNPHYAFTLYPFSIAMITLITWEIGDMHFPKRRTMIISFILLLSVISFFTNWSMYKDHWYFTLRKEARFPFYKITDYLKKVGISDKNCVAVFNVPAFFYYTDHKAEHFDVKRIKKKNFLSNLKSRGINYILANTSEIHKLNTYRMFSKFIDSRVIMVENAGDIGLFKILYDEEINRKPDYESNFSEWLNTESIINENTELDNISPGLMRTGGSAAFKFTKEADKNNNKIKINLIEKVGRNAAIQFGYFLGQNSLNLNIKPGDNVTFIVRARLSHIEKCKAFIFVQYYIQNYNNWERKEIRCYSDDWINYSVNIVIPGNSTMIYAGILYESDYKEEYLELMNPQIFIDRSELIMNKAKL